MDITYDNSASFTFISGSMSTSFTIGSGTGRVLLVTTSFRVTGITYNSISMTEVVTFAPSIIDGNQQNMRVWRLNNPSSGSNTLAITASGDGTCSIISFSNVNTDVYQPVGNATGYSNNGVNNTQVVSLSTSLSTSEDRMVTVLCSRGSNSTRTFVSNGTGTFRTSSVYIFGDGTAGIYDSGAIITPAGSSTLTSTWASSSGFISNVIISLSPIKTQGLLSFFP